MIRRIFMRERATDVMQPRIAPDPKQAAELERRRAELSYAPGEGFHRDRIQSRIPTMKRALR